MKIHKITEDRIFFLMDSGAYGSIKKSDANNFLVASNLPPMSIDSRREECIISTLLNTQEMWETEYEIQRRRSGR